MKAVGALGTDDSVETGVAARAPATLGVDSKVVARGAVTTTLSAETVLLGAGLSVTAADEDAGELAVGPTDLDDDPPDTDVVGCVVAPAAVAADADFGAAVEVDR